MIVRGLQQMLVFIKTEVRIKYFYDKDSVLYRLVNIIHLN